MPVIGIIQVDDVQEVLKSTSDELELLIVTELELTIINWANENNIYLKVFNQNQYLLFMDEQTLNRLEQDEFSLLEKIKNISGGDLRLTVSMGIGAEEDNFVKLGELAQAALELALMRGGDQVIIKDNTNTRAYGGQSIPVEKKTRVKARIMAHTLKDLILEHENIIVMGHRNADFDCLGAALGVAQFAKQLNRKVSILVEDESANLNKIKEYFPESKAVDYFVRQEELQGFDFSKTLLVVVDVNTPKLLVDKELVNQVNRVVVIDHHRITEDHISNAFIVYQEVYASSTSELVSELLQYVDSGAGLDKCVSTTLLAGVIVDTKNFIFQTGVRTFEVAAYLRQMGADGNLVRKLLQDDLITVTNKSIIISNAEIIEGRIALSYYPEWVDEPQKLAAMGADALINIKAIELAFVICPIDEQSVTISARSSGKINVHAIMEKLGGGGHFNMAAVQIKNMDAIEARNMILNLIKEEKL